MSEITVLAVVSEIYPLIKTGGLADVAGALAGALAAEGVVEALASDPHRETKIVRRRRAEPLPPEDRLRGLKRLVTVKRLGPRHVDTLVIIDRYVNNNRRGPAPSSWSASQRRSTR